MFLKTCFYNSALLVPSKMCKLAMLWASMHTIPAGRLPFEVCADKKPIASASRVENKSSMISKRMSNFNFSDHKKLSTLLILSAIGWIMFYILCHICSDFHYRVTRSEATSIQYQLKPKPFCKDIISDSLSLSYFLLCLLLCFSKHQPWVLF